MAKPPRRKVFQLAAGAAALSVMPRTSFALDYPTRPVRIVVGFPAGNGPDIVARLIGRSLSQRIGQPVIVENRPGAGGTVGTEVVVRAPPDGYTLLWIVASYAYDATLYPNLYFNFIRDIAPVAGVCRTLFVLVVNPSVPAKTIPEFIAYAKSNPGKINMASFGNGTANHVFGELFKMMAGIEMVHVPYRSSPMPDLLAGQVQVAFIPISLAIPFIKDGKLRALAVTTVRRLEVLPGVPAVDEFLPGYEASGWQGIGGPKNLPGEIIDRLYKEINAVVADPGVKTRFADIGVESMSMTPAEFGKFIADESEKWAKVIKFANIKPE